VTDWAWDYNPSAEYVTDGRPTGVVAEVERLAPNWPRSATTP